MAALQDLLGTVQRSTKHQGSKRRFSHRPDYSADIMRSRASAWSVTTGRPLPPAARIRTDHVSNAAPMPNEVRTAHYAAGCTSGDGMTPARRKRARRKIGSQLARLDPKSSAYKALYEIYLDLRDEQGSKT